MRDGVCELSDQVDPMDDRANIAYAALPERLYIVQDGQIIYQVEFLHFTFGVTGTCIYPIISEEKPFVSGGPWSF